MNAYRQKQAKGDQFTSLSNFNCQQNEILQSLLQSFFSA